MHSTRPRPHPRPTGGAPAPRRWRLRKRRVALALGLVLALGAGIGARLGAATPRSRVVPGYAIELAQDRLWAHLALAQAALDRGAWSEAYEATRVAANAHWFRAEARYQQAPSPTTRATLRVAQELAATFRFDGTFAELVRDGDEAGQELAARESLRLVQDCLPQAPR